MSQGGRANTQKKIISNKIQQGKFQSAHTNKVLLHTLPILCHIMANKKKEDFVGKKLIKVEMTPYKD